MCGKNYMMNSRGWARPVSIKTEDKLRTTKLDSRKSGWNDKLRYLPHASSGFLVVFLVLPGSP